jgi:hypothetical protein
MNEIHINASICFTSIYLLWPFDLNWFLAYSAYFEKMKGVIWGSWLPSALLGSDSISMFPWHWIPILQKNCWTQCLLCGPCHTKTKLRGLSPWANYTDRRLSAKLVPTFAGRGYHLVSVTSLQPYSRLSRPSPCHAVYSICSKSKVGD